MSKRKILLLYDPSSGLDSSDRVKLNTVVARIMFFLDNSYAITAVHSSEDSAECEAVVYLKREGDSLPLLSCSSNVPMVSVPFSLGDAPIDLAGTISGCLKSLTATV